MSSRMSQITKPGNIQNINNILEAESLVSSFPKVALKNEVIAALFRHYIEAFASSGLIDINQRGGQSQSATWN
jgi:hypothetical protein